MTEEEMSYEKTERVEKLFRDTAQELSSIISYYLKKTGTTHEGTALLFQLQVFRCLVADTIYRIVPPHLCDQVVDGLADDIKKEIKFLVENKGTKDD